MHWTTIFEHYRALAAYAVYAKLSFGNIAFEIRAFLFLIFSGNINSENKEILKKKSYLLTLFALFDLACYISGWRVGVDLRPPRVCVRVRTLYYRIIEIFYAGLFLKNRKFKTK